MKKLGVPVTPNSLASCSPFCTAAVFSPVSRHLSKRPASSLRVRAYSLSCDTSSLPPFSNSRTWPPQTAPWPPEQRPASPAFAASRCMGNGQSLNANAIFPSNCRSEEHTSELQSLRHLVCRLLLEK